MPETTSPTMNEPTFAPSPPDTGTATGRGNEYVLPTESQTTGLTKAQIDADDESSAPEEDNRGNALPGEEQETLL